MLGATYNAQFLVLEHRFYGESQPFDDWSLENLAYLNSEQALADLAYCCAEAFGYDGVALFLVIDDRLLLCGHHLWILLGAIKAWSTQTNTVTLTESPI